MNFKPILSVAVLLAAITASAVPTGFAFDAADQGRQIAETNDIILTTDEAAISLSVLSNANDGALPELEFDEAGNVICINGLVSGKKISGKQDAVAAVKNVAALLGVDDFDSELEFEECQESIYNDVYSFRQVYQGIQVESGYVTLVVDKNSRKALYLNSSFAKLSLDTAPAVSAAQAATIIRNAAGADALNAPELIIRTTDDGSCRLAWRGFTANPEAEVVYADAQTGELLNAVSNSKAAFDTGYSAFYSPNPILGSCYFNVSIERMDNGDFRLHDTRRHIWVGGETRMTVNTLTGEYFSDAQEAAISRQPNYLWNQYSDKVQEKTTRSSSLFTADNLLLGTLAQVEKAYDFYSNSFGWNGTDGNNAELYINGNSFLCSGASSFLNYIDYNIPRSSYGGQKPDACDLDLVVHEYTHRVTAARVKWSMSSQTSQAGALNEAYSDIMGEYAHLRDWTSMAGTNRNAKLSPASGKVALNSDNDAFQYYNLNAYLADQAYRDIDCHEGSTIISHAAYLMEKYGIPAQVCKDIWFNSMSYLRQGANSADFNNCRNAVLNATNQVLKNYTSQYTSSARDQFCVYAREAFNAVGIKLSFYKMGDINGDNKVNQTDVTLITRIARGNYQPSIERMALGDVNYDGRVNNLDAETITRAIANGTENNL